MSQSPNNFRIAVENTEQLHACYKSGLQALSRAEKQKIELQSPKKCDGSVFIDQCLVDQKIEANSSRWDYALAYNGKVYFVEFHSASSDEVSRVIKKLKWLKVWLNQDGNALANFPRAVQAFHWIQSGKYDIPKGSKYERQASQAGIKPKHKLILR
jgi:hypothetical protein